MENIKDLLTRLSSLELEIQEMRDQLLKPSFQEPEMVLFDGCQNPFYIGKYPVTQALWESVMGNNPSYFKGDGHPVEQVSWNDTQEFIQKLNEITGKAYRLPTEYEWMLAATVDNTVYSGSDDIDEVAWYSKNSDDRTHPVGLKKPNSLDIYDMSGNVWEWCQDWYIKDKYRVIRGGSWNGSPARVRCADRNLNTPDFRDYGLGFRLARTV